MSFYRESEFGAFGKPDHEQFFNRAVSEAAYKRNTMAAKKNEAVKEEAKPAQEAPKAEAPKPTGKVRPSILIGQIVHFHREENTQTGSKLTCLPAMLLKEADLASNFKPEDGAVDLKVFTKHGDEVKNGIMYSEAPKAGYWSYQKA